MSALPKQLWLNKQPTKVQVRMALKAFERVRGLLFRPPLKVDEAILIRPCNSVHMFGMRYAIDVVFLDASNEVVKLVPNLKPWQMAACLKSKSVLELPTKSIVRLGMLVGNQVEFK
ncbi:DUF192 domain-containing protein [Hydrogenophaga sp. PAMC20947]|uniref:DUF192 domain-containing protein n=1 Tax=Hydrogenophaga sp. PAMC20947 TaxID=2565558 RepID=UPI00109E2AA5|nr:DUF192 domain-containing protein [Hydrogenophaga sp. PAMC20947]QCB47255.1 DUF192 domain-containing protein [Hydrogenophaga sp. PAMC20947]